MIPANQKIIPAAESDGPDPVWAKRFVLSLAISAAYLLISHSWSISKTYEIESQQQFHEQENRQALQQKGVTRTSTIGFLLIAAVGGFCAVSQPLGKPRWNHPLTILCLLYLSWCVTSILWSQAPGVSFRKTTILALLFIGVVGMSRKIELDDVPWIAAITTAFLALNGFAAEIALGTFGPWKAGYRFAGTVHPNSQGMHAVLLCLAAFCLILGKSGAPRIRYALLSLGGLVLFLTKSRTSMAALVVAVLVLLLVKTRGQQRVIMVASFVSLVCLVGIGYEFVNVSTLDSTANIAAMGRQEGVGSLTGRVPLWRELLKAAEQRPLAGQGYGSFWTEENIRKYSEKFAWRIPQAHNAYLDIVLGTGLIGLALYLLWAVSSFFVAADRYRRARRAGDLFVLGMIVMSLVHGFAESKFPSGGMGSFFLYFSMVALATRPPSESLQRDCATEASSSSQKALARRTSRLADRR